MKRVFFDECGNTGQNLLDDADPIFVLASCSFQPTEEQEALAHFHQFKGPELKFARLRKTPAGQRAVLTFLRSTEVDLNNVSAVLFHKPFMVVTKYCDLVLEPSFRNAGVDFYRHGLNIAIANLLTTVMPVLLNRTTWSNFLAQFVRVVRERNPIVFKEWRSSAELIFSHFEHTHPKAAYLFAPVILLKDCRELFETLGDDELDPLVPAYNILVDHWGKVIANDYEVIADQSKVLAKARKHFLALSNPNLKRFRAGYDRRKIEFPLKVSDIIGVDSAAHKQVQLADIVGGALASAAKARIRGPLHEGTFAYDVFEICFAKVIIVDALWPSHELDPKMLGTSADPEPNDIDAATYASMILRGHASTKADG